MPPRLLWPTLGMDRGPGFWLRPANLLNSRRHFRSDHSNEWRYEFLRTSIANPPPPGADADPAARSRTFSWLLGRPAKSGFRCAILGDTGEGDYSQYGLLPVLRALKIDFMIINGDVAYPAGTNDDYAEGFFKPYAGLGIPVWAVPGNHDYYSAARGREFFEIFCSEIRRGQWDEARLILRPQPGTYWELMEPDPAVKLVILGVDSGHSADLDGTRGKGFLGLGRRQPPDRAQHDWLEWRLRRAQQVGASVILLYHIPALVREGHQRDSHLSALHRLIAQFPCIRLVATAHEHNFQRYEPRVFGDYLRREYSIASGPTPPTYLVSGSGGAYISATDFAGGARSGYPAACRYPSAEDWRKWAPLGLRMAAKAGLDKSVLKRVVVGLIKIKAKLAEESDADRPERLSFLFLEYRPGAGTTVQPLFVDDLATMYDHLPADTPVRVQEGDPAIGPAVLTGCLRDPVIPL
jgi:hypothetical protein